jgi:hypothetical protein
MRTAFALAVVLAIGVSSASSGPPADAADRDAILALHAQMLKSHTEANPELFLQDSAEDFFSVFNGDIRREPRERRLQSLRNLFGRIRFTEYVDLVPPEVRVSPDGKLAWLVAQTKAAGVRRDESGAEQPIEYVTAWVVLFEKRDGRWTRMGVSSFIRP